MKQRILITFLALSIIFTLFVSCKIKPSNTDGDDFNNDYVDDKEQNNSGSEKKNNPDDTDNKEISIAQIYTGYNEGLMFVDTQNYDWSMHGISCIDKTGKTVFTIDAYKIISGFHNGLALVQQEECVLCDKTGKIITAQELGGTSFISDRIECFEDGFILVKKTTTSYNGSIDEMAVFNISLEKIVDYSSDLYTCYYNDYRYAGVEYYNGYLIDEKILDLRTGTQTENRAEFIKNMELKNDCDFYSVERNDERYYIYDERDVISSTEHHPTVDVIIDLSDYRNATVISGFRAGSGLAGLKFTIYDSEVGNRYYFTIMDTNGKFLFEPIETQGEILDIKCDNGNYVLRTLVRTPRTQSFNKYFIEIYNQTGRIATKEYDVDLNSYITFDISDDIIYVVVNILHGDNKIDIFSTDLQPLFKIK